MDANRREFTMVAAEVTVMALRPGAAKVAGFSPGGIGPDVWHRRVERTIQISFNESDFKLTGNL
jgi:hypothetical protein